MRVLFLFIAYPDVAVNTNMYTDLTAEFVKNGHDVCVAAPGTGSTRVYNEGNTRVLRIKTFPLFNTSKIRKGIANLLLPYQYEKAIMEYFGEASFDLIVTPTPPITFVKTVTYLKLKFRSKVYVILRDIFPQNAKDLGMIKNSIIFNFFRRKEKELYQVADSIGCMSLKNIEYVLSHNPEVDKGKLHLLPNWTTVVNETKSSKGIRLKYNLTEKFVAIFAGNFGIPQKIEFLIEIAELLKDRKDILLLLVGEGTEKTRMRKIVSEKGLENVRILDQLPRKEYLELLAECDIGLVNLSDKFTIPNIPSRTLSYWSEKLPVLAAIDSNTDYGDLLDRARGGLWSITGNADAYLSNLLYFYNNAEERKKMGENGFNYLINELNSTNAFKTIVSKIS